VEGHQFRSKNEIVLESTDKNELWSLLAEQVLEDLAKFQMNGSGWTFHSIVALDIHTVGYKPLRGGTFVKLPKFLSRKEALVNMKFRNETTTKEDNQCFKWCIARALNPVERDSGRISKILRKQAESLNFTGIEFPLSLKAIDKFGRLNPKIAVSVLGYENSIHPLRISKFKIENNVTLLLENTFVLSRVYQDYVQVRPQKTLAKKNIV